MEDSPEVRLPPVIKTSNNQNVQARVDEKLIQMEEKNPSSDFSKTNIELISANQQSRNQVAAEIREERSTEQAGIDSMTQLLNRKGFEKRLKERVDIAGRNGNRLVGIFIDADGLKKINDEKGHDAGDIYLKKIATLLQQSARQTDIVGRLGGDEFVTVLDNPDEKGLNAWAERVIETDDIQISAGAIDIDPKQPSLWKEKADEAMYAAKLNKGDGKSHLMVVKANGDFIEYIPDRTEKKAA
jgi:diguanylate cyclase (GGDEF)-like protein